LMELGARLCTPAPACTECPMTTLCGARKTGAPERFPAKRVRKRPIPMRAIAGVVHRDGGRRALLIVRRPIRGLLGGLWELPNVEGSDPSTLRAMLREQFGIRTTGRRSLGRVEHAFTHRALTLDLIELRHTGGALRPASEPAKWCSRSELKRTPLSTLMKKSLSKVERPSARTRSS
ncbi:MAG: NUDIX domain-containing protein, partial [Myxococcota bacterium]